MDINFDLAVKNGRVFTSKGQVSTDIWIQDGRIAALGGAHRSEEKIDARGMLVLPGAIDVHVHFRDPGPNYKEDWASGSASAAAGGVTAVIDQPNTVPRTMDARSFEEKLDIARHRSFVDFGLNGGPGKIDELKRAGASAIGEIFSYEHSDADLTAILGEVEKAGMLASLHAEDGIIIKEKMAELGGRHDPEVYSLARPARAEAAAIEKACAVSKRLHICHLSSAQGLAAVEVARRAGHDITAEVAPHHLLLNDKDYRKQGSYLKMNPPLRGQADNDALWQALRCGSIDILASDHAPHLPEEKREDIWEAPPGVPGVETMLPLDAHGGEEKPSQPGEAGGCHLGAPGKGLRPGGKRRHREGPGCGPGHHRLQSHHQDQCRPAAQQGGVDALPGKRGLIPADDHGAGTGGLRWRLPGLSRLWPLSGPASGRGKDKAKGFMRAMAYSKA